jgi:integrase
VWSRRDHKKLRKTFPTRAAAIAWQRDAATAVTQGRLRAPSRQTIREAADAWVAGATAGAILTKGGDTYKPSVIRSYRDSLGKHVVPEIGGHRISELRRADVQALVERMNAQGSSASTTRNAVCALRVVIRRSVLRQEILIDPTVGLALPAVRGRRTPAVSADEVRRRLDVLDEHDRALWSTVFFCGMRLGELRALQWSDVDLDAGLIAIERGWDRKAGFIAPKSRAGRRLVPMPTPLRRAMIEHRLKSGRTDGFAFGTTGVAPFDATSASKRARRAWEHAGLTPVTFHEGRHLAASLMIDSGIGMLEVSRFLGHATIGVTIDRYSHLVTGAEARAALTLDAYLERQAN